MERQARKVLTKRLEHLRCQADCVELQDTVAHHEQLMEDVVIQHQFAMQAFNNKCEEVRHLRNEAAALRQLLAGRFSV